MRTVRVDVVLPDWAKWKAQDEDGELFVYDGKPTLNIRWNGWDNTNNERSMSICVSLVEGDWTESLREIK